MRVNEARKKLDVPVADMTPEFAYELGVINGGLVTLDLVAQWAEEQGKYFETQEGIAACVWLSLQCRGKRMLK